MVDTFGKHIFNQNDEIIEYLKTSRLFSVVAPDFRSQIASLSRIVDYDPGAVILEQGTTNDRLYFLMRGVLGIYVDGEHVVDLRRKGDIIGEMSMIAEKPCAATVKAESAVRLFEISQKHLSSYRHFEKNEMDQIMYKIFAMILTEKLEMTNYKAKEYEAVSRHLVDARENFYQMIEKSPESVFELDHEGTIVYFNKRAEERSGYSRTEIVGKKIMDTPLINREIVDEMKQLIEEVLDGKEIYGFETPFVNRHGTKYMTEMSIWSLGSGHLVMVRNITERKQAEQELQLARENLEKRVEERTEQLVVLNRELQQEIAERKRAQEAERLQSQQLLQADKLISLGILVSGVAHEINNPNQFITSNIAPLRKAWDGAMPILDEYRKLHGDFRIGGMNYSVLREKLPTIFSNITEGSRRINNIVEELREYVREMPQGRRETFDLNSVVQSALTLTSNLLRKSTNRFETDLGNDIPLCTGHYQRIEQVVINLVQNACQALSSEEEAITISTRYDADSRTIKLIVADEGRGIDESKMGRLTDPFYTTKRDSGGIGLGLSITSRIVAEHNGTLQFAPGREKGTIVTVSLPLLEK